MKVHCYLGEVSPEELHAALVKSKPWDEEGAAATVDAAIEAECRQRREQRRARERERERMMQLEGAPVWGLVTDEDGNEHWELVRDGVEDEWE